MIKKFRKKPVVIEAVQVVPGCYDDMTEHFKKEPDVTYGYITGVLHPKDTVAEMKSAYNKSGFEMWIKTLEGTMTANMGDWIIKGVNGEFYPCKPDIFEKTYEEC